MLMSKFQSVGLRQKDVILKLHKFFVGKYLAFVAVLCL